MNDLAKNLLLWVVILVVLISVFQSFANRGRSQQPLAYSDFVQQVKDGQVAEVKIVGDQIAGELKGGTRFETLSPETDNRSMIGTLLENNVKITAELPKGTPWPLQLLMNAFPILLLIAVWVYFMRQMQGGGGGRGALSFGKSRARMLTADQVKVTFNDVAGVEEAKQ
ncbi:MAG TPA: ATP-dependent metallopeptidase FtsH/Yme1/Tma family protein, partial [Nevskiaceae bacterium]|nr:ATP-dependent metallopeptidase FtsH/Yme1/Tma family protein [Nevskiaceae bacterium]